MTVTDTQREAWSRIPVDDVGYLPSSDLLNYGDDQLRVLVAGMERTRYEGWRNHEGLWRKAMKLDEADGLRVLDYGCGTGLEALQYARAGALVSVADIRPDSVRLAATVLRIHGFAPAGEHLIGAGEALLEPVPADPFEVVLMSGVLHHIPEPEAVLEAMTGLLAPGGEIRVMAYSDIGWRIACSGEPPQDVAGHPDRMRVARFFDAVGDFADWYDEDRLAARFGKWYEVRDFAYITPDSRYLTATLRLKPRAKAASRK